ncbi:MAG TPA: antitoxin VapB family protein [archaeon]|nr:antitoxin VapB family protein [archaeon]
MVRMISVTDSTYDRLKTLKDGKSFSKILDELMDEKSMKIMSFAGILGNERSSAEITEMRRTDRLADKKRAEQLKKKWAE